MDTKLAPETQEFWEFIGERLKVGQEQYGVSILGAKVDLDQMSLEEAADFAVYMMAKIYQRIKKG